MTLAETAEIMRMLSAAYPNQQVSEATIVLWARKLENFDFAVCLGAVDMWIEAHERFPVLAQIIDLSRTVMRRAREDEAERRGLPDAGPANEAQVKRIMGMCREVVKETRGREHWHGGPDPCRVCGGMNPNLLLRRDREPSAARGEKVVAS